MVLISASYASCLAFDAALVIVIVAEIYLELASDYSV